jgi:hypothetical protein
VHHQQAAPKQANRSYVEIVLKLFGGHGRRTGQRAAGVHGDHGEWKSFEQLVVVFVAMISQAWRFLRRLYV